MKNCYILFFLFLISNCKEGGANKEIKLIGINGEAYYHFDRNTNEVVTVIKRDYFKAGNYIIMLRKDTLHLNDDLIAYFSIYHENYKVVIEEPAKHEIKGSYKDPVPGVPGEYDKFIYRTKKEGLFELKGWIEVDTVTVPFSFKFLVIK